MRRPRLPFTTDSADAARDRMVRDQLEKRGISDGATLAAMGLVPREEFVPPGLRERAYEDRALSIGHGQTISQPFMVATMTAALALSEQGWPWIDDPPAVLDVGTGSGYQAAVLAQLGARVTSVERDAELAQAARQRLAKLGYDVSVVEADGSEGYAAAAPYAGIIVGAAAPGVPPPLIAQLADDGRLVIPVGPRDIQRLTIVHRRGHSVETRTTESCVFVPLRGRYGQQD